jgi:hypothetical protein
MANIRNTKKDIDYVVNEVIADCLNFLYIKKADTEDQTLTLIDEMLILRDDLYARVNNIDGKDNPALVKAHFRKIFKDLEEKSNVVLEKLSALIRK